MTGDGKHLMVVEDNNAEKIRVQAYHLWEAEGRPQGRDDEFWVRAIQIERQASGAEQTSGPPEAKRAATARPSRAKKSKTLDALVPPASKKAPKRQSRATVTAGAAEPVSMHLGPTSAERA